MGKRQQQSNKQNAIPRATTGYSQNSYKRRFFQKISLLIHPNYLSMILFRNVYSFVIKPFLRIYLLTFMKFSVRPNLTKRNRIQMIKQSTSQLLVGSIEVRASFSPHYHQHCTNQPVHYSGTTLVLFRCAQWLDFLV